MINQETIKAQRMKEEIQIKEIQKITANIKIIQIKSNNL
jgi:hypothetical protein